MDSDAATLAQALESLIVACTPADAEPNRRGEMRSVRTPDWTQVEDARKALRGARGGCGMIHPPQTEAEAGK